MTNAMRNLQWSVQALAQPAETQLALFPDFVCKAEELALDFDEWQTKVITNERDTISAGQLAALSKLDAILDAMSGESQPFWTEESLRIHCEWQLVRLQARNVLRAFGWNDDVPPTNRAIYIGPPN